jgi:hypothetical protein
MLLLDLTRKTTHVTVARKMRVLQEGLAPGVFILIAKIAMNAKIAIN